MQTEHISISMTPGLYQQFIRLKTQSQYDSDQDLLQACFEAWERLYHREANHRRPAPEPYMSRPALSLDDYDT